MYHYCGRSARLGLGVLVASAISVKLLLWLIKKLDDPTHLFNNFRGKKS